MSAFDAWFIAQHGPRVSWTTADDEALRQEILIGMKAKVELALREQWDARRESAMYAWRIMDQDKATNK